MFNFLLTSLFWAQNGHIIMDSKPPRVPRPTFYTFLESVSQDDRDQYQHIFEKLLFTFSKNKFFKIFKFLKLDQKNIIL